MNDEMVENKGSTNTFPIKKKLRITIDIDVAWFDTLGSDPDADLQTRRQHLVENPLLLNKLFGKMATDSVSDYLSQIDNVIGFSDFDEEDLFYAANLPFMTSDKILDVLTTNELGFSEETLDDILATNTFEMEIGTISVFDREVEEKVDMSPIPVPMVLEQGEHYLIGQGKGETMLVVSGDLLHGDMTPYLNHLDQSIDQALNYSIRTGSPLTRIFMMITIPPGNIQPIEARLINHCQKRVPQAKLDIYIDRVDRFASLGDIFPGLKPH